MAMSDNISAAFSGVYRAIAMIRAQKVDLVGGKDIEITDAARGLILKSPDGSRWRLTINNAGAVAWTKL